MVRTQRRGCCSTPTRADVGPGGPNRALRSGFILQPSLDGRDDLFVARKTVRVLLSDHGVANPDGKFPASAGNHLRIDTQPVPDERGHTGRARQVVSTLAVADVNRQRHPWMLAAGCAFVKYGPRDAAAARQTCPDALPNEPAPVR